MITVASDLFGQIDPVGFATHRLGFTPDPKQALVLSSPATRGILKRTRQWGKSTVTAARAVYHAFHRPGLVLSPNAARIVNLPGNDDTIRGFSAISLHRPRLAGRSTLRCNGRSQVPDRDRRHGCSNHGTTRAPCWKTARRSLSDTAESLEIRVRCERF